MMKQSYRKAYDTHKEKGGRFALAVHRKTLSTPKKVAISASVLVVLLVVGVQFLYSTEKILPFAKIDSVAVGGMEKKAAIKKLNGAYGKVEVPVYFSSDTKIKVSPSYKDLGVKVDNSPRVAAYDYPWYMRVVPTSLLWYGLIDQSDEVKVTRDVKQLDAYFAKYFGAECTLDPVNAGLEVRDGELKVIPAVSGGVCDYDELHPKLEKVPVQLKGQKIVVKGTTELPAISDEVAEAEKARVEDVITGGVTLQAGDTKEGVPAEKVYEWLQYTEVDAKLQLQLDAEKVAAWLEEKYAKQFAVAAGVTTVVTRDFTELSRSNGANGQALDTDVTKDALTAQLRGEGDVSSVATRVVAPAVKYQRSYSPTDTGLSALMRNYAEAHPGTYGVSLIELTDQKRRAEYNATTQFTAASTYKLFVAYSTMLRVEDGRWSLNDSITGGRNLAKCLDDMIVLSDNACAEALLRKVGFTAITNEARAMGATSTSFLGNNGIKTSARDQSTFMGALYSGQILSQQSSRDRILNALKRNIYRKGIPAGVAGATVADKVGFLDGLLHDSAIVYSSTGTYVLVIMTDGSSWANIADLAKQLQALRSS